MSKHYSPEYRDTFVILEDFFKEKGDERTFKMLESLLDSSQYDADKNTRIISVDKADLYDSRWRKMKSYLVKGDTVNILQFSSDKKYYQIKYIMKNNRELIAWITKDSVSQ
ncbi:hypothetical protein [Buttiauxella sp.]|uniref:hypothetical protein n=1 Tax=Buttiauxella sp. TaxID=1972222 RepID=UPI003C725B1A